MFYFSRNWKPCVGISCEKRPILWRKDRPIGLCRPKYQVPPGLKSNDTIFNLKFLKTFHSTWPLPKTAQPIKASTSKTCYHTVYMGTRDGEKMGHHNLQQISVLIFFRSIVLFSPPPFLSVCLSLSPPLSLSLSPSPRSLSLLFLFLNSVKPSKKPLDTPNLAGAFLISCKVEVGPYQLNMSAN